MSPVLCVGSSRFSSFYWVGLGHRLQQTKQPRINKLAVLEEVLAKKAFLLKAALFEDTSRRWIVREDMGGDFVQSELLQTRWTTAVMMPRPQKGFTSQ